ncbi:MAG: GNAT family N-acetyltransferase [Patescibacteria group bacterium]|nr:GNAT family N-acetyltransferase [Patescibacteria group bacterium]
MGKCDGKLNLKEEKKKWFGKTVKKHGPLAKVFLLGRSEVPAGYIQFGPITEFSTAKFFYKEPIFLPRNGWCITCISIGKAFRGRGIAVELIRSALDDLKNQRIKLIDVYPVKKVKSYEEESTGTARLWKKFNFEKVEEKVENKPFQKDHFIMRLLLR